MASDKSSANVISGYTPIGIIGYSEITDTGVTFYNIFLDAQKMVNIAWRCSYNITNHSARVYVLYLKNNTLA